MTRNISVWERLDVYRVIKSFVCVCVGGGGGEGETRSGSLLC